MVSYWKTQWFRVICGIVGLALCLYFLFQPGADESTLEGLRENTNNAFASLCWFINSIFWFAAATVNYHHDRLELLEKKAEKYDALCEEVSALYEANRIDREHMKLLEMKINDLKYELQEMKKK